MCQYQLSTCQYEHILLNDNIEKVKRNRKDARVRTDGNTFFHTECSTWFCQQFDVYSFHWLQYLATNECIDHFTGN